MFLVIGNGCEYEYIARYDTFEEAKKRAEEAIIYGDYSDVDIFKVSEKYNLYEPPIQIVCVKEEI